jgi:hypothetical protein
MQAVAMEEAAEDVVKASQRHDAAAHHGVKALEGPAELI